MSRCNWQEEIRVSQEKLFSMGKEEAIDRLRESTASFVQQPLQVIDRDATIEQCYHLLESSNAQSALVQAGDDSILGVIEIAKVRDILEKSGPLAGGMRAADIMNRNICIESESSSLAQVLNRMVFSECADIVLIDRRGIPSATTSASELLGVLHGIFPELDDEHGQLDLEQELGEITRVPLH